MIEDHDLLAEGLAQLLELEGHHVIRARDGREGYDLTLKHGHDLIITDLMLPQLDGIELIKRARAQGVRTHILVLSAAATNEVEGKVHSAGAQRVLRKPAATDELLEAVQELLDFSLRDRTKQGESIALAG